MLQMPQYVLHLRHGLTLKNMDKQTDHLLNNLIQLESIVKDCKESLVMLKNFEIPDKSTGKIINEEKFSQIKNRFQQSLELLKDFCLSFENGTVYMFSMVPHSEQSFQESS